MGAGEATRGVMGAIQRALNKLQQRAPTTLHSRSHQCISVEGVGVGAVKTKPRTPSTCSLIAKEPQTKLTRARPHEHTSARAHGRTHTHTRHHQARPTRSRGGRLHTHQRPPSRVQRGLPSM